MIKCLFFDYYGVINSHDAWGIEHVLGNSDDELISAWYDYCANLSPNTTADEIDNDHRRAGINRKLLAFMWLHKEIFSYGLISNANQAYARPEIERLGFDVLLNPIVISSELGHAKPSPTIFEYALQKAGYLPENVIFIDDGVRNIEGAKAVGMHTILFDTFEQMQQELAQLVQK